MPQFDIKGFKELIEKIKDGDKAQKLSCIKQLLEFEGLKCHCTHNDTSKKIIHNCDSFEYPHEYQTSLKLIEEDYHVLFTPSGYFRRHEKKFDIFLIRNHVMVQVDLKQITSINPDTIGKRIKDGSDQASRLVIDMVSPLPKKTLIEGLRTGCSRNSQLIEILMFYNSRFYRLQTTQIMSKKFEGML